jgi:hypothetical protein
MLYRTKGDGHEYYRRLARALMADAAAAEDPMIAARHRERAQEYLLLAEALEDAECPAREIQQQRQQHQQRLSILLHADEGQVHGVLIRCRNCGSYNATEA